MAILRFNDRTKKGRRFFELLKKAEEEGYLSFERVINWRASRSLLEKEHGKAIIIKDFNSAIKILEELLNQMEEKHIDPPQYTPNKNKTS